MKSLMLKTSILSIATAVLMGTAGCSGGGSSSDATGTTTYSGGAVDGYLQGATVFVDSTVNKIQDLDEQNVTTDTNGDFTLSGIIADGTRIYAYGGIDRSTTYPFEGRLSTVFDSTQETVLSPLTTFVAALVDKNVSVADATALVAANLGINAADVNKDPMTLPTLFLASQKVQKTIEVLATAQGGDFNTAYESVFSSLATITENNATGGDFNTSALAAETGVTDVAVVTFLTSYSEKIDEFSDANISVTDLDDYGLLFDSYTEVVQNEIENNETISTAIESLDVNTTVTEAETGTITDPLIAALAEVQSALDHNISYLGTNSADSNITANLVLTDVNAAPFNTADLNLTWSTNNSTISSAGIVTRSDTADVAVELKATVKNALASANKKFNLIVKKLEHDPVAEDRNATIDEEQSILFNLAPSISDLNGDTPLVTAVTQPTHGTVSFTSSTATYLPELNFNGSDSFTYTVTDDTGRTDTATVTVTVNAVDDATIWHTAAALPAVAEDFGTFTVELNATDVDGAVTYALISNTSGINAVLNDSTLSVSSVANASGTQNIVVSASEGGVDTNLTLFLNVAAVNDAPVAGDFTPLTIIAEDSAYTFTAIASDVDSASLTYSLANNPAWMSINPTSGAVSGTPANADVGTASNIQVLVTDGIIASPVSIATFSVTVSNTNDAPVASAGSIGTLKNETASGTLVASDMDVGDTLTYSIVNQASANGTVTVTNTGTGTFTYTPTTDYLGEGSFTFKATDANGTDSNVATVTISVVDAVISITAADDTAATNEDTNITIDVLGNDVSTYDINSSSAPGTVISAVSTPANGTASIVSGGILYTPNANFNGSDSFTYTAQTLSGNESTATVLITVSAVDDAIVWNTADTLSAVDEDFTPFTVELNATDVDGAVTYALVGTTGIVNAAVSGSTLTVSPIENANGEETIIVSATQGGVTANREITLAVNPVNDAPVANADAFSALLNTTNADGWDILANDIDVEGPLSIASCETTTSGSGSVIYSTAEVTSYTPADEFVGTDTFSCTITDGDLNATALVSVIVSGNHAPVASGANITMTVGESITGQVIAFDADDDNLTFSLAGGDLTNLGGSNLNPDGTYTITASSVGSGQIVVTVADDGEPSMSTTATYYVNVLEAQAQNSTYEFSNGGELTEAEWDANATLDIPADTKLYSIWGTDTDDNNVTTLNMDYLEFMSDGSFIVPEDNSSAYSHDGVVVGSNVTDGNSDGMIAVSKGTSYSAGLKVAELKLLEVYEGNETATVFPDITMPSSAVVYKTAVKMAEASYYLDRPADDCTQNPCVTYPALNAMIDNNAHGVVSYNQDNYTRLLVFGSDQNLSDTNGTVVEVDMTDVYANGGDPFVINANAGTWSTGTYVDENDQSIDMVVVTVADGVSGFDNKHTILVAPGASVNGETTTTVFKGSYDPAGTIMLDYRFNDVASAVLQNVINPVTPQEYMDLNISSDINSTVFDGYAGIIDPAGVSVYNLYIYTPDGSTTNFELNELVFGTNGTLVNNIYINGELNATEPLTYVYNNGTITISSGSTDVFALKIIAEVNASQATALTGFALPEDAVFYETVGIHLIDSDDGLAGTGYHEYWANSIAKEVMQANFMNLSGGQSTLSASDYLSSLAPGLVLYDVYDVIENDSEASICFRHVVKAEFGENNSFVATRITDPATPQEVTSVNYTVNSNVMTTSGGEDATTTFTAVTGQPYFMTGIWTNGIEVDDTNKYFLSEADALSYAGCTP